MALHVTRNLFLICNFYLFYIAYNIASGYGSYSPHVYISGSRKVNVRDPLSDKTWPLMYTLLSSSK